MADVKLPTNLETLALVATQRYYRLPRALETMQDVTEWLETHAFNVNLEGRLTGELRYFDLKLAYQPFVYTDSGQTSCPSTRAHTVLMRWDSPLAPDFWLEAHFNLDKLELSVVRGRGVPHDCAISFWSPPSSSVVYVRWDSLACPDFWLQISVH